MSEKQTKVIELPVIPREVAEAIESLRKWDAWSLLDTREFINEDDLIAVSFDHKAYPIAKWLLQDLSRLPKYTTAVTYGYTVEKSPEEKVGEYYVRLQELQAEAHSDADHDNEALIVSEEHGVISTLNLLGIKIEGVNA